jgi:uncharacterized protein (TIGR02569 family)
MPAASEPPPASVVKAFGSNGRPRRLSGRGAAWKVDDLVLKRVDADLAWLEWEERVLTGPIASTVRIQRPRRALNGALAVEGWFARNYLVGEQASERWPEIIAVGDALHAALADLPSSVVEPLPANRTDAWAIADRFAWGEEPMPPAVGRGDRALEDLLAARRPVRLREQIVHGDLTGNVLVAEGMAPAVIDFSPYRRPPAYAIGVIVADAVVWDGAGLGLLDLVADRPEMGQCLLRALIFRHVTALVLPGRLPTGEAALRYAALRRAALSMSAG